MKIQLAVSKPVDTLEELLDSISQQDSHFDFSIHRECIVGHLSIGSGLPFTFFGSPAVHLTRIIIDSSALKNLHPVIFVRRSIVFRIFQTLIVLFAVAMVILAIQAAEYEFVAFILVILGVMLLILEVFFKFGAGVVADIFEKERNA